MCNGNGLWMGVGYRGTPGNRDHLLSRIVLKAFIEGALTTLVGGLFQNETARHAGDGVFKIAVGGIYRRGRVALCGLNR